MKSRFFCFVLAVFIFGAPFASGQKQRLPRDLDKLLSRAQTFWSRLAAGERATALELILPERKEAFLASPPMSIVSATVLGFDLADDPQHARVRIRVAMMSETASSSEGTSWTWDDNWVWRGNNWYADIGDPRALLNPGAGTENNIKVGQMQREIDSSLSLPKDKIDLGTLIRGQILTLDVPVDYSGKLPLTAEQVIPSEFITASSPKDGVTAESKHFTLYINASDFDGAFSFPLRIRFRNEAATAERSLTVTGTVLTPLTFRQVPPAGPLREEQRFSVFVRNNTPQPIPIQLIATDDKIEVLESPVVLAPNSESEVVLQLMRGRIPDRMDVILTNSMQGVSHFSFQIKR